jgi:hypothetical protein
MTCSQADEGCPFIQVQKTHSITFEDQKHLTTQHNKWEKYKKESANYSRNVLRFFTNTPQ